MGNQCGDAVNQGGNLSIAVEMTSCSNKNGKFKERREVKLIENEHICKNVVSHIWSGAFLINFGRILHNVFLFLLLILSS